MDHASDISRPAAGVASAPRGSVGVEVATHRALDPAWSGRPLELGAGYSRVELTTTPGMAADERGLVHGGFAFAAADHAAMLAVNDPHVVLAAAEVRFLAPVTVGQTLVAEARVVDDGRGEAGGPAKPRVEVEMTRDGEAVFTGTFRCYVPPQHVLGAEDGGT